MQIWLDFFVTDFLRISNLIRGRVSVRNSKNFRYIIAVIGTDFRGSVCIALWCTDAANCESYLDHSP